MTQDVIYHVKTTHFAKLVYFTSGTVILFWTLNQKQLDCYKKEITCLNCFSKYDLCEKHLSRPHLTCISCKLRLVVIGKAPIEQEISIHQVWNMKSSSRLKQILFKNALSLAESLS